MGLVKWEMGIAMPIAGVIKHVVPTIKCLKSLINKRNYISVYHWEFPGMSAALVAKVRGHWFDHYAVAASLNGTTTVSPFRADAMRPAT